MTIHIRCPVRQKSVIFKLCFEGPDFAVCIHTENQNQAGFCPFALREVSVLAEPALGHLRYSLTDVPPQPNSPPDTVIRAALPDHKIGA